MHVTIADILLPSLPSLQTPRLRLRPCHIGDAELFRAMTNDPGDGLRMGRKRLVRTCG